MRAERGQRLPKRDERRRHRVMPPFREALYGWCSGHVRNCVADSEPWQAHGDGVRPRDARPMRRFASLRITPEVDGEGVP